MGTGFRRIDSLRLWRCAFRIVPILDPQRFGEAPIVGAQGAGKVDLGKLGASGRCEMKRWLIKNRYWFFTYGGLVAWCMWMMYNDGQLSSSSIAHFMMWFGIAMGIG